MNPPNRSQTDNVDSARQQILSLVREIELLSDSKAAADLFYPEYLKRVVMALGADAAAIWMLDERQQGLALKYHVQRIALGIFENPQAASKYQQLLHEALQSGGVRVYRSSDPRVAELPTPHVLITGALQQGTKQLGVLMILQRSEAPEEARAGYLQFVEQICSFVPRYIRNFEQPSGGGLDSGKELQDLRRMLLEVHGSLKVGEIASVAANDGAKFLGCDRVSVAERYGVRTIVRAVSGQESVNARANLIRLMGRLVEQVLATGERLQYSGKPEGIAPQMEEPLAEFLDVSRARLLTVLPIMPREPTTTAEGESTKSGPRKPSEKKQPLGALVVEQVTENRFRPDFELRLEVLAEHLGQALTNAQEQQSIFLLPLWQAIGKKTSFLRGRRLVQVLAVLATIAVLACVMAFVPWDYRVEGDGRLMPVHRQNVFAPWDGKVVEIHVASGQHVEKGEVLLKLQNEELHARWLTTSNEMNEKRKQLLALQAEVAEAERSMTREDQIRLRGKISQTQIELEGATKRLEVLSDLEKSLVVHSPLSGTVATFQVVQLLTNRPVRRGDLLLEVMDETGPWRLELEVPEQRLGHILEGQEQLETPNLPVEFVLASATESTHEAKLESSATRSVTSEESGAVIEVFASLDASRLPHQRIGSEVKAKINCGKQSLGYVLFGDVIEFVRKRLWL